MITISSQQLIAYRMIIKIFLKKWEIKSIQGHLLRNQKINVKEKEFSLQETLMISKQRIN